MNIQYKFDTKRRTSSGKPCFDFSCSHCRTSFLDLSHYLYDIRNGGGINPETNPQQAAQEFSWFINSNENHHPFLLDRTVKRLRNVVCNCDEKPTGLVGQWFRTNSRVIEKHELDSALDQLRLYGLKDEGDCDSKNVRDAIKNLKNAVKDHNKSILDAKSK